MNGLKELKEILRDDLEEYARKGDLTSGELEKVHTLTDTIKNIDKICALEDGGYSNSGEWGAEIRGSYGRDRMRGGRVYYNNRRDGRYSRDGKASMREHMEQMLDEAGSEKEREAIRRCMSQLESV